MRGAFKFSTVQHIFGASLLVGVGGMASRPRDLADRMARRRSKPADGFVRETFSLPREEAREKARSLLKKYPKAAYMTEVERWRELPDDEIEFTMRRLPTAD
jgi:hypothetical protein